MPISATSTRPAWSLPGRIHRPGLAAWKVTVAAACTAWPSTTPLEASTPLGTSTLTTRTPARSIAAIASATGPWGTPLEAGSEQRIDDRGGTLERLAASWPFAQELPSRRTGPSPGRRSRLRAASPASSSGSATHTSTTSRPRVAQQPRDDEPVAAVVALAADDRDGAVRCEPLHRAHHGGAGALHQIEAGHALLLDRPAVDRPHRLGVGERREPRGKLLHESDGIDARTRSSAARRGRAYSTVTVFARLRG